MITNSCAIHQLPMITTAVRACRRQPLTAAVITAASNWWNQP